MDILRTSDGYAIIAIEFSHEWRSGETVYEPTQAGSITFHGNRLPN